MDNLLIFGLSNGMGIDVIIKYQECFQRNTDIKVCFYF